MSWEEIIPLFQAGKIAMWADTSTFYEMVINSDVLDPEDVGIAKFPAGTQNDSPYFVTSWGLAISSFSKNQENAKKFLEWATSAEMAKIAMLNNIPVARSSVWQDEEVLAGINPELIETQAHAAANGIPEDRPNMISVQEARRLIGTVITKSIQSGGLNTDAARLAAEMAQDVNNLLEADFETYGQY